MSKITNLFKKGTKISYVRDEIIVRPEDSPPGVFLIAKGHIKSYGVTKFGNINIHLTRNTGDVFPLIWTFSGIHRDIYYAAMDDVEVIRLSKQEFVKAVNNDIELCHEVNMQLVNLYMLHAKRIDTLEYRSAYERVVSLLINIGDRFGAKTGNSVLIGLPLRHHEIADSANMSRETASREMSKLERKKLIRYVDHQIELLDLEQLKNIL